ncbi:MAG: hypothetical protein M3Y42_20425 [Actinomycetota bacterium]|nr:hypothetical protein [Actinomycetota bacterium]MDQ2959312.1 hypothetical protein [Actinomycetota bacterium]
MRAARERQVAVWIGDVPAAAATLGEPYMRGTKKVQAMLISPRTGHAAKVSSPTGGSVPASVRPDPKLRNVQGSTPKATDTTAITGESPVSDSSGTAFAALFNDLSTLDSQTGTVASTEPKRPSRRRWPLFATAAAFLLSIGIPVALHLNSSSHPVAKPVAAPATARVKPATAPAGATAARQRAELLSWVTSYLPRDSVIVTDQASGTELKTAGFTSVLTFGTLGSTPVQTVDYVVDVPGSQAQQGGPAGRGQLLASSLPLAAFGSGAAADTARELFASTANMSAREHADADLRRQGGSELSANPAIVADAASRSVLVKGQLDLRAQNVLTLLASTGTIYLTNPVLIPAEQRLGQPVRSIVITSNSADAVQNILNSMIAPYKPDTIVSVSQRKLRLSWNPAIAPVATVGQ